MGRLLSVILCLRQLPLGGHPLTLEQVDGPQSESSTRKLAKTELHTKRRRVMPCARSWDPGNRSFTIGSGHTLSPQLPRKRRHLRLMRPHKPPTKSSNDAVAGSHRRKESWNEFGPLCRSLLSVIPSVSASSVELTVTFSPCVKWTVWLSLLICVLQCPGPRLSLCIVSLVCVFLVFSSVWIAKK